MSKKLYFLISFLVLLVFVGGVWAAEDIYWDDGDPCDHLWSSPNNWNPDAVPVVIDAAAELGDCAYIESGFSIEDSPHIDASVIQGEPNTGSETMTIIVATWNPGDAYLTMTGGYVSTVWEFIIGLSQGGVGTVNMTGGMIELGGSEFFISVAGTGYLNMTDPCGTGGGTIQTNGGPLALPGTVDWHLTGNGTGTGFINLHGGTIICSGLSINEGSLIDVNEGVLIIDGDARTVVAQYADQGRITGAGNPDPRHVGVVYDDVNDLTIVTYDPDPDYTLAWRPNPGIGEGSVNWEPTLSWEPGSYADVHTVYFGSSLSDVNESATPVSINQPGKTYPVGSLLEFGQTYYWRVDEVNDACAPGIWQGAIWNFTIGDYVSVDDFDSYTSDEDLLEVWDDYWTNGTGAEIYSESDANFARSGRSLRYEYDNGSSGSKPKYSETEAYVADLEVGSDWTASAKALVLYFYGQSDNDANERMYVGLDDGSTVGVVPHDGDANEVKEASWHEWNVELQDFNDLGVVLSNVTKVYIGFGVRGNTTVPGGAGTVYFDDIGVYPTRCVGQFAPAGDVTGDCSVDEYDVNMLCETWLVSDYNIAATEPIAGPVGWWKLDEGEESGITAYDSAGDNDGELGGPSYLPDWLNDCGDPCHSPCFDFDGVGYFSIPNEVFADVNDQITITLWQYGTMPVGEFAYVMFQAHDGGDPYDLTIKGEFFQPSATGCAVWWDAGYGGGGSVDAVSGEASPENYDSQWNHWVFTKNSNTGAMAIYLNGVLFADQGEEYKFSPLTGTDVALFKIGSDADGERRYDGYMSDFRVYNYELSYGEVRYVAGQIDDLYVPLPSPEVDVYNDGDINFRDFAVLADGWLEMILWP